MGLVKEFREFAIKGNVMDLAVGVIIGAAFQKIVDSLVKDILTPILTPITHGVDFKDYHIGPFAIGNFVNNIVQFMLVAFALFLIVKTANKLRREQEVAPPPAKEDPVAKQIAQNERMIELLESIANNKPAITKPSDI